METMEKTYYKVLGQQGEAYHGGSCQWSLPTLNEPLEEWVAGKWMPPIEGDLEPCQNGYHLCELKDLRNWFGPRIFVAEYKGRRVDADNKIVVRNVRLVREVVEWNERTARLFAVDCVEHALCGLKKPLPDADKLREVLAVCRRFANGEATKLELDAAGAAAGAAAWAAAWAAARDAEIEWQNARLPAYLEGKVAA